MDFDPAALLQILILAAVIYLVLGFLKSSRGGGLVRGLLVTLIFGAVGVWWLAKLFALEELEHILGGMAGYVVVVLAIVFQPELRRGIAQLGVPSLLGRLLGAARQETVAEVALALRSLAKKRRGALIAFERETPLDDYVQSGVRLDAAVNRILIESIFHPGGALHDGAIVIRKDRVAAALVLLPLTENVQIAKSTGTRHRAALGLTDETDAVTVAVSEETGDVSICQNGEMRRPVPLRELEGILRESLSTGDEAEPPPRRATPRSLAAWLRGVLTTEVPRKVGALLIGVALFQVAHRDLLVEQRLPIRVRLAPDPELDPAPRAGQILLAVPDADYELLGPDPARPITLVVRGTRADTESLSDLLAGVLRLRQETPPQGIDLPLDDVSWSRLDGRDAGGLEIRFESSTPPRLLVERLGQKSLVLRPEHVPIDASHLDPTRVPRPDELTLEPSRVVVRGPRRLIDTLDGPDLPFRLEPLVLTPADRGIVTARLRLDPSLEQRGFRLAQGSYVEVSLPVEPAPRDHSTIEREIALVDLRPARERTPLRWELPPHAQTARFRILSRGLVPEGDEQERQARSAAVRRYVENNLLAFIDVSGVGPGGLARIDHSWRKSWREALKELDPGPDASLWVELESESELLLTERSPAESDPGTDEN